MNVREGYVMEKRKMPIQHVDEPGKIEIYLSKEVVIRVAYLMVGIVLGAIGILVYQRF